MDDTGVGLEGLWANICTGHMSLRFILCCEYVPMSHIMLKHAEHGCFRKITCETCSEWPNYAAPYAKRPGHGLVHVLQRHVSQSRLPMYVSTTTTTTTTTLTNKKTTTAASTGPMPHSPRLLREGVGPRCRGAGLLADLHLVHLFACGKPGECTARVCGTTMI